MKSHIGIPESDTGKLKKNDGRREGDETAKRYVLWYLFVQLLLVFTFSLTFFQHFPIQHHSPSSGSSSDSYDSEHERQDRPKSKKSKGTYRDHDGELVQVSSGSGTGFNIH